MSAAKPRKKAGAQKNGPKYGPETFLTLLDGVRETPEGRWFLLELIRVSRPADVETDTEAVALLRQLLDRPVDGNRLNNDVETQLRAMSDTIANARAEIAAIDGPDGTGNHVHEAKGELDAIVEATEHATSDILEAAEQLDEISAAIAELDGNSEKAAELAETLGSVSAGIFMACSFQDITGQRISKVVKVLKELERRVALLLGEEIQEGPEVDDRPDAHLLNGPSRDGEGVDQAEIDKLFA